MENTYPTSSHENCELGKISLGRFLFHQILPHLKYFLDPILFRPERGASKLCTAKTQFIHSLIQELYSSLLWGACCYALRRGSRLDSDLLEASN